MMPIIYCMVLLVCGSPLAIFCQQKDRKEQVWDNYGTVTIKFKNTIHGNIMVLNDSSYINSFGENYAVSSLKYYVGNTVLFSEGKKTKQKEGYQLINQAVDSSLQYSFAVPVNDYDSIRFLLGVDSIHNTSGAQTDALDALNNMFWTWNSGYIMFKLEGTSPQSNIVNHKIEYHIGGYKGNTAIAKYLTLTFPSGQLLKVKQAKTSTLLIEAAIDKFWQSNTPVKIAETPVCSSPGELAKRIAQNYYPIFKVVDITNAD